MPSPPELHRLLPQPVTATTIGDAYTAVRAPRHDRPYIGLCMIMSLDGSIAVEGQSGQLGNQNDIDVLLTLRSMCDMIIVGAATVRGEGYGPPKKAGQRLGVVTNTGAVDLDSELFTSGAGFVITNELAEVDESRVDVLRAGRDRLDVAAAVARLTEIDANVRWVQAEGGAAFNGSLLDADVIDELDLTISPNVVGGSGPRLTAGAHEHIHRYEIAHLLADTDGFMFSRWLRAC